MKIRFFDMIEEYIKKERQRAAHEVEVFKRGVLEDFATCMDIQKKDTWYIKDIKEKDGINYYNHLKYRGKGKDYTEKRIKVVNHFFDFAINNKWIGKRPWTRLFEEKKTGTGHFRVSDKERKKLLGYLETLKPKELFETRDRAMLLILLSYRLRKTEISGLDINNYDNPFLEIKTPFLSRNRKIELKEKERNVLDTYLIERSVRKEAPGEEALFIGFQRRRIAPGMVKQILNDYLMKVQEG